MAKGHLRRANTLPYIASANITTLADTLVAAILLGNRQQEAHGGSRPTPWAPARSSPRTPR